MYTIDIRLKADDWQINTFATKAEDMLTVCLIAFAEVKRRVKMENVEFLPVGNLEYVIWAEKACQGFLAIIDNGTLPLSEDLDVEA